MVQIQLVQKLRVVTPHANIVCAYHLSVGLLLTLEVCAVFPKQRAYTKVITESGGLGHAL